MSGRMTRSRFRNAAMDMPPPPPQAFHGYAGHAPAGGATGSSSGQQSGWVRYVSQPEAGGSSWQSAGSSEWEQTTRTNWAYDSGSISSGAQPLFVVRHSFSARGYRDLTQGITTSTSESVTSMKGCSRPKELSPNIFKTPHDTTRSNKQITKPPWNCFESSMKKLKLSTGTMGITLHPVSKPAWGGRSPRR